MNSVPFELPVSASEAAAVAELLFRNDDGRKLSTEETRIRLISRVGGLGLQTLEPLPGSLQSDPVHSSSYYLAVDSKYTGRWETWLLRMSLASAQANSLFPNAILIGRMRPGGGPEVIVSAIPFGPGDEESIKRFAEKIDTAFLPKPMGSQSCITVRHSDPAVTVRESFEAFRQIQRKMRVNLASHAGPHWAIIWGAICTGWRTGYSVEGVTRVVLSPADAASRILPRQSDLELSYLHLAETTAPDTIRDDLTSLRATNRTVQFVAPRLGAVPLADLAAAARAGNAALSLEEQDVPTNEAATLGRVNYKVNATPDVRARLVALATELRG